MNFSVAYYDVISLEHSSNRYEITDYDPFCIVNLNSVVVLILLNYLGHSSSSVHFNYSYSDDFPMEKLD